MAFLSGYTLRKAITIDNTYVDSDLTDFPLLVKFTSDSVIGANIDTNGYNIRFTAADGTTLLKYERQSFTYGGGSSSGVFWVKVPTVAGAADTTIYIYYKSASPSDGQDASNVWDSNFKAVYHMEQDPSGSAPQILDSTSNAKHGTAASMESGDLEAGTVGNRIKSDGAGETITVSGNILNGCDALTVGGIIRSDKTEFGANFADSNSSSTGFTLGQGGSPAKWRWSINKSFAGDTCESDSALSSNTSTHVVGVRDSSGNMTLYINGVAQADTGSKSGTLDNTNDTLLFSAPSNFQTYSIDELRFSSTNRSASWIKFEYRNIFEADNEISFGSEETDSGGVSRIWQLGMLGDTVSPVAGNIWEVSTV